jgi:ABC-type glycerol-3-phosphate transport system substrate-binding protein
MPNRLHRSLVPALLALVILSACSQGTSTPTSTPTGSTSTGTPDFTPTISATQTTAISVDPSVLRGLNLQVWDAFSAAAGSVFTDEVAQFNASNQWGIVITQTGFGDYPTLFDAVNSGIESGGTPDLVAALPEQTLAWDASGLVVDLTPYLNDPTWGLGNGSTADFPSIFWNQDIVGGKQLGVPAQRSARFLFYNKTWAHELGFDNPPGTADEFRQQACAANASFRRDTDPQNDGYGGWIVDTDWQTVYSWMLAFGGGVVDGNGSYGFKTDPNLAALQYLKGLYDDYCAWLAVDPTNPKDISHGPYFDLFAKRLALFVSGDLAEVPMAVESMSQQKNSDEWTLLPYPGTSEGVLVAYGPSYSVLKSSPEKELAAWLFTRWLLSPENQSQWVDATGLFPLTHTVESMMGSLSNTTPQWTAAVAELSSAQRVPQLASWRKVRYLLQDAADVIFQTNVPLDQIPAKLIEMDTMAKELGNP